MKRDSIEKFMALAGQQRPSGFTTRTEAERRLGAQLLLSEVLEYVIRGLGVTPEIGGVKISNPEAVTYHADSDPDPLQMLDGVADVAYTMFWNAVAFGLPLEQAFELVCDNNLTKFVKLDERAAGKSELPVSEWHCYQEVRWPGEVTKVEVISYKGELYAVGKDARGKVRKPSTYESVELGGLVG